MNRSESRTTLERPGGGVPEPETRPERRRRLRVDPVVVALAVGSLLLSTVFAGMSVYYNDGRLIPPLDDVYIHLQYGRQIGLGHPFEYNTGDPITTGASSLLYALVLGAAWAAGFQGTYLLAFAVGFGAVCVAATTVLTYLTGRALAGRTAGAWAGALVLASGPLLWGSVSGMEVGLTSALLMGSVLAFVREQPRGRFLVTPLVAALLAIVRPEGLIIAAGLVAGMLWTIGRTTWADRMPWGRAVGAAAVAVLPLVAGAGQLLFQLIATGSAQANGVLSKSILHQGELFQPVEIADRTLHNLQDILSTLTGIAAQDLVPPATLAFTVIGLIALAAGAGTRNRTLAVVLAFGLAVVLLSVSTLITATWQNLRYVQPLLPVVLLLAVLGVAALARLGTDDGRPRTVVLHGVLAVALLFSAAVLPTWGIRLAQQAATIREAPVSIGNWLSGNLPPGAVVGVNDVGATTWFSGHRTVDLTGLTTNGLARAANNGPGTVYEALRRMPADQRPSYFSLYDAWGGPAVQDIKRSGVLGTSPLITFNLKSPARPIAGLALPPCQSERSCNDVSVWKADWSVAGSGDLPDVPAPGVLGDHVNVGDLDDEQAHGWTSHPAVPGIQPRSSVAAVEVSPGRKVTDSGRRVVGGESFTLDGLTPGRPVLLTGRIGTGQKASARPENPPAAAVSVDDAPVGVWRFTGAANDTWVQTTFEIPADRVTSGRITVALGPEQEFLGPYPDYISYGYWAGQ